MSGDYDNGNDFEQHPISVPVLFLGQAAGLEQQIFQELKNARQKHRSHRYVIELQHGSKAQEQPVEAATLLLLQLPGNRPDDDISYVETAASGVCSPGGAVPLPLRCLRHGCSCVSDSRFVLITGLLRQKASGLRCVVLLFSSAISLDHGWARLQAQQKIMVHHIRASADYKTLQGDWKSTVKALCKLIFEGHHDRFSKVWSSCPPYCYLPICVAALQADL